MSMLPVIMLGIGALLTLGLVLFAFAGPSVERAGTRRLSSLRERHSTSAAAAVEAQMRRITGKSATKVDVAMARFLPRPVTGPARRLAPAPRSAWIIPMPRPSPPAAWPRSTAWKTSCRFIVRTAPCRA